MEGYSLPRDGVYVPLLGDDKCLTLVWADFERNHPLIRGILNLWVVRLFPKFSPWKLPYLFNHQTIMTPWCGNISTLLVLFGPPKRHVMWDFDVFFATSLPELAVEQRIELWVIWVIPKSMWCHHNLPVITHIGHPTLANKTVFFFSVRNLLSPSDAYMRY